ncbi:MAG: hypothetical protein DSY35_03955, partial [Desulfurobacterium sp.]
MVKKGEESFMKLEVVTLGALLHDIGKFYQRGIGDEGEEPEGSKKHEDFSEKFVKDNKDLISFILGEKVSEEVLNFLRTLVQCHHLYDYKEDCFKLLKDESVGHYIRVIKKADGLSAGVERIEVDKEQLLSGGGIVEEDRKDYRKKTLLPIFCLIRPGKLVTELSKEERAWGYRFLPLSGRNIEDNFPIELSPLKEDAYPDERRKSDYRTLWNGFKSEISKLLKQ